MFPALIKAFGQLDDPRLRGVLKFGILGALACYLVLVALVWWAISAAAATQPDGWVLVALVATGKLGTLVLPLLFFPALATAAMSFKLEQTIEAVEERHYPALNWPRPQKWTELLATALRFLFVLVVANLLALPVYLALLFTGLTVFAYYGLNGYLLGREYFEMVALRRLDPPGARLLFRNHLGRFWLAGAIITFLFSIPVLNLAAPVLAAAFMTHVFHRLQPAKPKV